VTDWETLSWSVDDDGIATLTLDRPEALNAFDVTMARELERVFLDAAHDDSVRAIVVTGAGRAFCAGMDLSATGNVFGLDESILPTPTELRDHLTEAPYHDGVRDTGGRVTLAIHACPKPVIAAINGPAVGFGITLTLPMDIRLASSAARIGFVFARRGVVPEAASTWFLPRLVGISQAAEWVYTGRVFSAEEALAGRLVSRVVAPEALLPAAHHLAREIADNSSAISVTLARQMMWKLLGADHPIEAHLLDSQGMFWTGRSADAREGIAAFLD